MILKNQNINNQMQKIEKHPYIKPLDKKTLCQNLKHGKCNHRYGFTKKQECPCAHTLEEWYQAHNNPEKIDLRPYKKKIEDIKPLTKKNMCKDIKFWGQCIHQLLYRQPCPCAHTIEEW